MIKHIKRIFYHPLRNGYSDLVHLRKNADLLQKEKLAYYNFWDDLPVPGSWFYNFTRRPRLKALAEKKSIGFYSVFGKRRLLPLSKPQIRIFYTGENLAYYPQYQDYGGKSVDLALGFDHQTNHPNYLRFPIWLIDVFHPADTLASLTEKVDRYNQAAPQFLSRNRGAVLMARHDRSGLRGQLCDLLQKEIAITYPGAFRNNTGGLPIPDHLAKYRFIEQYMFNICPENSMAPGYVTEKVFHAIQSGCIPVYWGDGLRPEPAILQQEAILIYDPSSPQLLVEQLSCLIDDDAAMKDFAAQPRFTPQAAEVIYGYYERLEEKLIEVLHN